MDRLNAIARGSLGSVCWPCLGWLYLGRLYLGRLYLGWLCLGWLCLGWLSPWWLMGPAELRAARPTVEFNLPHAIACREIPPSDCTDLMSNEKLVEATLRFSVRVRKGQESDIDELLLEVHSPNERVRVVDYTPRTQLESEVAGEVQVLQTTENVRSAGASIGGPVALPHGGIAVTVNPSANLSRTRRELSTEKMDRIAPMRVIVASGTSNDEHGVFFKWKASLHSAFEDTKEVRLTLALPQSWRGDWIEVRCVALSTSRTLGIQTQRACGQWQRSMGLYMATDDEARRAAELLSEAHLEADEPSELVAGTAVADVSKKLFGSGRAAQRQSDGESTSLQAARQLLERMAAGDLRPAPRRASN